MKRRKTKTQKTFLKGTALVNSSSVLKKQKTESPPCRVILRAIKTVILKSLRWKIVILLVMLTCSFLVALTGLRFLMITKNWKECWQKNMENHLDNFSYILKPYVFYHGKGRNLNGNLQIFWIYEPNCFTIKSSKHEIK